MFEKDDRRQQPTGLDVSLLVLSGAAIFGALSSFAAWMAYQAPPGLHRGLIFGVGVAFAFILSLPILRVWVLLERGWAASYRWGIFWSLLGGVVGGLVFALMA